MHNLLRQVTSVCCVPHASFMKCPTETCHGELFKCGGNNKSKSHILMQKIRNQPHSHLLQRPSFEHYYCSRKKHKPVEVSVLLCSDMSSCAHYIFVSMVLHTVHVDMHMHLLNVCVHEIFLHMYVYR